MVDKNNRMTVEPPNGVKLEGVIMFCNNKIIVLQQDYCDSNI